MSGCSNCLNTRIFQKKYGEVGKIGVVVVLFCPVLEELARIRKYVFAVAHTIIMDNSPQNNAELIARIIDCQDKYTYISHSENVGLCKALNEGIMCLMKIGCKWACVFDADSNFSPDIFNIYRKAMKEYEERQIAIFAPVHTYDRKQRQAYDGYQEKKWAMTSGCAINIETFVNLGGFFETLFVDGLDMDYCFRAREKGHHIIECGAAIIKHCPAKTKKITFFKKTFLYGYDVPARYFMQARGLIWMIYRYKSAQSILMYLYKWLKVVFLFPDKKNYIKAMINGTKEGKKLYIAYRRGDYCAEGRSFNHSCGSDL